MAEKVTLGVTGGIAAYKAAELVRALQEHGLDVHVAMTRAAEKFIRPLTFASLTGHKVIRGLWSADAAGEGAGGRDAAIEHIAEAQSTRLLLVAPATAGILARFAHGLASDFLSTMYLATTAPVMVAPAMNVNMWMHPATQANIRVLRERNVRVIEPEAGYLACGMTGSGRLADVQSIADAALAALHRRTDLAGETVLITAGGTREPIDPVRFLGNRSSGKMGYGLAQAALDRGARVILVSGPSALQPPAGCEFLPVIQASEMRDAVLRTLPRGTLVIGTAAVADFRAAHVAPHKIKRNGIFTLTLEPTEDIMRVVVEQRRPGTLVIAFAAETEDAVANARAKLQRKGADAIVLNDVARPGIGFDSDRNAATWITSDTVVDLAEASKRVIADAILDQVTELRATEAHSQELGARDRVLPGSFRARRTRVAQDVNAAEPEPVR